MSRLTRHDLDFPTVPSVLTRQTTADPDALAVLWQGQPVSRAELLRRVRRATAGMQPHLARGERFAIMLDNRLEWIVGALAGLSLGGILVPLSTRFRGPEIADVVDRSAAKVLLTSSDGRHDHSVAVAAAGLAGVRHLVVGGPGSLPDSTPWAEVADGPEMPTAQYEALIDSISPDDVSDIIYTSGTTGRPKGVIARHGQTVRAHGQLMTTTGYRPTDRVIVIPPFFHSWGYKSGWLGALILGAASIPVPAFDAHETMQLIRDHAATALPGPPMVFEAILAAPDRERFNLSSLRLAFPAATNVPASLVRRIRDDLGISLVSTAYGLTETLATVTANEPDDTVEHVSETVGRPIPGCRIRIVGESGQELPSGQTGEIEVSGFNVTTGYWDDEAATHDLFHDGWARTGDIGRVDDDGYLRITDRKKDMFIVSGFNAYPAEIERVLSAHAGVARLAVVGVPDPVTGEVGAVYVVPVDAAAFDIDEFTSWASTVLASYKVPRHVHVVSDLVYNPSGKVVKHRLHELARTTPISDRPEAGQPS